MTLPTDTTTERATLVQRLAGEFSRLLLVAMRETKLGLVRIRNAREKNPNVCHSHDFIDANEVMAAAFRAITGRQVDVASEVDTALWNEAWNEAKAGGFVS